MVTSRSSLQSDGWPASSSPATLMTKNTLQTNYSTSGDSTTSLVQTTSSHSGSGPTRYLWLLLPVILVSGILAFLAMYTLRKRRKGRKGGSVAWQQRSGAEGRQLMVKVLPPLQDAAPRRGDSRELMKARQPARAATLQRAHFTVQDLSLLEVLKVGQLGRIYRAKITRGNCRGHRLVTCKLTMRTVSQKKLQSEINIMKKLGYHKNVIQLLEWNVLEEPYILIMEHVGTQNLKSFLQSHRSELCSCKDLPTQLTMAGYFISLGMEHIASKKIAHRDLAARNILVGRFPQECKIAEFSLAADVSFPGATRQKKGNGNLSIPFRWYPPEYFKDGVYNLQGDVWAFGILLWELHSLGSSPYPEFETAKEVVYNVCFGYKMKAPLGCRQEVYEVMEYCWTHGHEERPIFSDITKYLEAVVENDADYIQVEDCFEQHVPLSCSPPWTQREDKTHVSGWLDSV
ncbi:tyrosine kinase receptor Cad96Ca isoform X2 [Leucoraja erinacea]|uniref:tyrosine kinase receptor Cad96Ca isoform X2 n=1 Tax=Leucoraja erinaceus TaxID=7782 RepID=UPI002453EC3F|nr:tyrosine kinase receptor Cad96Ca isoform X2 [Leucoraja erinacea]